MVKIKPDHASSVESHESCATKQDNYAHVESIFSERPLVHDYKFGFVTMKIVYFSTYFWI